MEGKTRRKWLMMLALALALLAGVGGTGLAGVGGTGRVQPGSVAGVGGTGKVQP
jgi:hypothetical protein